MTEPTTAAGRTRRWAVFEDEDHVFRAVTEAEGDDISWPEMGEDDVERMVDEHNAAIAEARAAALDEARALRKAVVRFFDAYDRTHLVHDVSYENVNDEAAALRTALAAIDALREGTP